MQLRKFASKLRAIVLLSVVLITGIFLVPTLQIGGQGQVQQQQSPPSPGGSPSSGSTSPPPPLAPERPPSPGGSPSSGSTTPALNTAAGAAVNKTGGSGAVNQSAIVIIPK